ncbi:MAG: DNA-directed RNA polymerase subunit omega [Lachnospiraceae bacterium]|nr:DNA-directed RNA polymerase subunit omega [Lachnospiraceae bacterium]
MIHPSYKDLLEVVNAGAEEGDPAVTSRYSIVLATAKRARQIINGSAPQVTPKCEKPLSIAVQEVWEGKVKILTGDAEEDKAAESDDANVPDWEAALAAAENGESTEDTDLA